MGTECQFDGTVCGIKFIGGFDSRLISPLASDIVWSSVK